jgi:hypothetical protein
LVIIANKRLFIPILTFLKPLHLFLRVCYLWAKRRRNHFVINAKFIIEFISELFPRPWGTHMLLWLALHLQRMLPMPCRFHLWYHHPIDIAPGRAICSHKAWDVNRRSTAK